MQPEEPQNPIATALETTIAAYVLEGKEMPFDLQTHDLRIFLKGDRWSGVVDRPVAQFLLDLDKRVKEELLKQGVEVPDDGHGFVVLRLKEGSLLAFLEFSPDLLEQITLWSHESKMLLAGTVLIAFGVWQGSQIFRTIEERKQMAIEAETEAGRSRERLEMEKLRIEERSQVLSQLTGLIENKTAIQAPLRKLVGKMAPGDVIAFPGETEPVKKEVATAALARRSTRSKARTYYIDQVYTIQSLDTAPGKWSIGLHYAGKSFKAKLKITDKEVADLLKQYEEAHEKGSDVAVPLQVTAAMSASTISGEVIGVGPPRANNTGLAAAIKDAGYKK